VQARWRRVPPVRHRGRLPAVPAIRSSPPAERLTLALLTTAGISLAIMRTAGAAVGAQLAAALISGHTPGGSSIPLEPGFTLAFAVGAAGLLAALLVTCLIERPGRVARRVLQPAAAR
jgi:hypothetical protein